MGGSLYQSHQVVMRDGVKIAIDVWRPADRQQRVPTIVRQTRYFRSIELRWPLSILTGGRPIDHSGLYARRRSRFVSAGYAWVDVDVRGSGASTGTRVSPWSQGEVADGYEIVDWILAQPWSDGCVGALGISYDGTAAELLLSTMHPAIKAIAPRFSSCHSFADIGFPGGLPNVGFVDRWHQMNAALDRNRLREIAGLWVAALTSGVTRVAGDTDGQLRREAVAAHAGNYRVIDRMRQIQFADDTPVELGEVIAPVAGCDGRPLRGSQLISPSCYSEQIRRAGAPIYGVSGWWDGAYGRAAAVRYRRTPNPGSRLLLGPWNHGGGWQIERSDRATRNRFDHDGQLLSFFDLHLRGQSSTLADEPPVRYFTMIQSQWKWADQWPPPHCQPQTYYLDSRHGLSRESDPVAAVSHYQKKMIGSGTGNRWLNQAQADAKVIYRDRQHSMDKRMCFRSQPLTEDIEVTGHPLVELYLACDAPDANLLVYLECVSNAGQVWMVSEAGLRLLHRREADSDDHDSQAHRAVGIPYRSFTRDAAEAMPVAETTGGQNPAPQCKVRLDFLPISYLFRRGERLQVSIAMEDTDSFASGPATQLWIGHGGDFRSTLMLPVAN